MLQGIFVYALAVFLAYNVVKYVVIAFRPSLRKLPGPLLARFSNLYRVYMVGGGDGPARYRQLHEKYGPIVRTGPNHVSLTDVSMIPTIYGIGSKFTKTEFYTTMDVFYNNNVMSSVFTSREPAHHQALKRPVASLFSMTNMKNFEPYADECTGIFTAAMQDLEGQVIDFGAWLQWYAFDVIASITFQRKFGFLEKRCDVDDMIGGLDFALKYVGVIGQLPHLHPWLIGNRKLMDFLKKVVPGLPDPLGSYLDITVEEMARYDREEKRTDRTDFLAQLRAKEAKEGSKLSDEDMVNHLSNNILAGSDTTGISLRACFYYLIKNPETYKKLVAQIDEADSKGQLSNYVTYEECLKLPYLQAVMKEAMRLHPGVGFPLERRVPAGGAQICGVHFPEGTNVSMSAPVIHLDQSVFGADAEQFRPDRWIDSTPEQLKRMEKSFFAFGYGARTCIGKNISIMEMGKFVPQVLRHFDIEWASSKPEWTTYAAWFWKQTDFNVKFKSRQKS